MTVTWLLGNQIETNRYSPISGLVIQLVTSFERLLITFTFILLLHPSIPVMHDTFVHFPYSHLQAVSSSFFDSHSIFITSPTHPLEAAVTAYMEHFNGAFSLPILNQKSVLLIYIYPLYIHQSWFGSINNFFFISFTCNAFYPAGVFLLPSHTDMSTGCYWICQSV